MQTQPSPLSLRGVKRRCNLVGATGGRPYRNAKIKLRDPHSSRMKGTVLATQKPEVRTQLEEVLSRREERGWTNLVRAIRSTLEGERNADVACEGLDVGDSMVIEAILQGLADPSSVQDLLPDEEQDGQEST
jgi:hypothetical protein